jgi:hypothetical protein
VATEVVVRDALSRLTPDDRELLRLVAWEGLEPREAAVVLGVPARTVRTRLSRARARLRAELDVAPTRGAGADGTGDDATGAGHGRGDGSHGSAAGALERRDGTARGSGR